METSVVSPVLLYRAISISCNVLIIIQCPPISYHTTLLAFIWGLSVHNFELMDYNSDIYKSNNENDHKLCFISCKIYQNNKNMQCLLPTGSDQHEVLLFGSI